MAWQHSHARLEARLQGEEGAVGGQVLSHMIQSYSDLVGDRWKLLNEVVNWPRLRAGGASGRGGRGAGKGWKGNASVLAGSALSSKGASRGGGKGRGKGRGKGGAL